MALGDVWSVSRCFNLLWAQDTARDKTNAGWTSTAIHPKSKKCTQHMPQQATCQKGVSGLGVSTLYEVFLSKLTALKS